MSKYKVDQVVEHIHREHYLNGVVKQVEDGCNCIYWVDFNQKFLTICTDLDLKEAKQCVASLTGERK